MEAAAIFDLPDLRPLGRFCPASARQAGALPLLWAGSGLELLFTGSELHLMLEADFDRLEPWIAAELNGAFLLRMPLGRGLQELCLFRGMTPGIPKRVRLYKETQPLPDDRRHRLWIREVRWSDGGFLPLPAPACRLEFVGDSLTSGEGLIGARAETDWVPALFSASRSWAKRAADLLNGEFRLISQSGWGIRSGWDNNPNHALPGIYDRVCAPAAGPANEVMGAQRPCTFEAWQPDAVVINLGTNDAAAMENPPWRDREGRTFRQTGDAAGLAALEDAALDFLRLLRRRRPAARLVWAYGMAEDSLRAPLERAVERFRAEDRDACYLPLPAVSAETMGSRQHPGAACHRQAAETAAAFLRRIL